MDRDTTATAATPDPETARLDREIEKRERAYAALEVRLERARNGNRGNLRSARELKIEDQLDAARQELYALRATRSTDYSGKTDAELRALLGQSATMPRPHLDAVTAEIARRRTARQAPAAAAPVGDYDPAELAEAFATAPDVVAAGRAREVMAMRRELGDAGVITRGMTDDEVRALAARQVADVDGREFGPDARVEVVSGSALSTSSAAAALLGSMVGWRGRVVAVEGTPNGGLARVDFTEHMAPLVMWSNRLRVVDDHDAAAPAGEASPLSQLGSAIDARATDGGRAAGDSADGGRAALLALVAELGITPATLRKVAEQVERHQARHVTAIETNRRGAFRWWCIDGDAEGDEYEVGEDAYRAATTHGPLVALSPFGRRPVVVHEGRGDNEHGVPRRSLGGVLAWEPYDGGEWRLQGYGTTSEIAGRDVAGAHAWAARLLGEGDYDREPVVVVGWEEHRDRYGEWWEPVAR